MPIEALRIGITICAIGVVIGVALEGVEFWDEYKEKGWSWKLTKVLPKFGFAILVVSLALETWWAEIVGKYDADRIVAVMPRDISPEQRAAIGKQCGSFKGRSVAVESNFNDAEAYRLSEEIIDSLRLAGLTPSDSRQNVKLMAGPPQFGVFVTGPQSESALVICLRTAFREVAGLHVPTSFPEQPRPDGEMVNVYVGLREIR